MTDVMDVHMPGSLDGIGVARLVRAYCPDLPVSYKTGRPNVLSHLQLLGPQVRSRFGSRLHRLRLLAAARRLLSNRL